MFNMTFSSKIYRSYRRLDFGINILGEPDERISVQEIEVSVPTLKVSATLKIAIFPYLRFQRFQIDMRESFLLKKKSEANIISVERYRG